MAIYDSYNTNPDLNTASPPAGAPTGTYPGTNVAQTFRSVMAAIRQLADVVATLVAGTFTSNVTIGTTTAAKALTVNGTATVTGNTALQGDLVVTGNVNGSANITGARLLSQGDILTTAANATFGLNSGAGQIVHSGALTIFRLSADNWRWAWNGSDGSYVYQNPQGANLAYFTGGGDLVLGALGSVSTTVGTANSNANAALSRANAAAAARPVVYANSTQIGPMGENVFANPPAGYVLRDLAINTSGDTTTWIGSWVSQQVNGV